MDEIGRCSICKSMNKIRDSLCSTCSRIYGIRAGHIVMKAKNDEKFKLNLRDLFVKRGIPLPDFLE
jgi:hypothetical protein